MTPIVAENATKSSTDGNPIVTSIYIRMVPKLLSQFHLTKRSTTVVASPCLKAEVIVPTEL